MFWIPGKSPLSEFTPRELPPCESANNIFSKSNRIKIDSATILQTKKIIGLVKWQKTPGKQKNNWYIFISVLNASVISSFKALSKLANMLLKFLTYVNVILHIFHLKTVIISFIYSVINVSL